jgi:hypothetical protein
MPAGAPMDRLVAEKVIGGPLGIERPSISSARKSGESTRLQSPSMRDSDAYGVIAAAWTRFGLIFAHQQDQTGHVVYFASSASNPSVMKAVGRAQTFALAVCRAALKAAQSG